MNAMLCARCGASLSPFGDAASEGGRDAKGGLQLTSSERMVFLMLSNGLSNKEIAVRLFISQNTVRFHLKQLYAKLGVRSRTHAVAFGGHMHASSHAAHGSPGVRNEADPG